MRHGRRYRGRPLLRPRPYSLLGLVATGIVAKKVYDKVKE
ncbi:hypothetical protein MBORA_04210 [Methanobrevibacter oralis]|uniref:Uncharacterized protein n=1 Tax=Methanobrevibacter oralis TaxID=66851 RepID=A0A162FIX3_METOA|nr:hypothetical protein MBORA_04210 [Methanobrevibacter oralis]